jgi:hypothetical protein
MVPLAHAESLMACRVNVDGIHFEPDGDILFQDAAIR